MDIAFQPGDQRDEQLEFCGAYPGEDLTTRFADHGFHLSDDRRGFLGKPNPLGTTIAGASLTRDQTLIF